MTAAKIGFIGGGNMARSIIGGLLGKGYRPEHIMASAPSTATRESLTADFGINVSEDNQAVCAFADALVLAVKPQKLIPVCRELKHSLKSETLLISVAAGITCNTIKAQFEESTPLVRCMPNTPSLVSRGVSGLFASAEVDEAQRAQAEAILASVGQVYWLAEETLLNAVTAVSGSGPAYFFLFMEAMVEGGTKLGLSPEMARAMALETAAGAAKLAASGDVELRELRRRVTSPGGTTERAIAVFEARQLRSTVEEAMLACAERAKTLADELGA